MSNKSKTPNRKLIWVYPPNKWRSNSHKTFVYGYCDPRARLFVSVDDYLTPERINTFPNGNFAKVTKLPNVENNVRLIQILKGIKRVINRKIYISDEQTKHAPSLQVVQRNLDHLSLKSRLLHHYVHWNNRVIVIDPGHGGKEHGTHSPKGVPEKHFNLQISKLLYKELKKKVKNVFLTRSKDKFVSLNKRVTFARKKKADILISIHHNALPDHEDPLKHRGIGIYYTHKFSRKLALKLLHNISKESGLKKYGVFKRYFALTRPDFCKSVLIECGFLTHPVEAEYITSKEVQKKIASGIAKTLD